MAIAYVSQADAASNTVSLPSFSVGNIAIVFATNRSAATIPTLPSGWTSIQTPGSLGVASRLGYRVLESGDTTIGTWTNATNVQVLVLSGQDVISPIGGSSGTVANSNQIAYPTLTIATANGRSWVVGMACHKTATDVNAQTVTGMTIRAPSNNQSGCHTAENVSSFTSTNYDATVNSSGVWNSANVEIRAATVTVTTDVNTVSGGDYSSLSAWEAGEQADLVAVNEIHEVICSGSSADTTAVTISGWTTSQYCYIKITQGPSDRHGGVWDTGKYRLSVSTTFAYILTISEDFVRIDGLQIEGTAASNGHPNIFVSSTAAAASSDVRIENCLLRKGGSRNLAGTGASLRLSSGKTTVSNTIMYGNLGAGSSDIVYVEFGANAPTVNLHNVTIIGNGSNQYGVNRTSGTVTAKNCYVGNNGTADYNGTMTLTTCAHSSSGTFTGSTASIAHDATNFTNVTGGSEDYHLVSGASSTLLSGGTDLSASFTTDIDDETRTAPWSIGADQYFASGSQTVDVPIALIECTGLAPTTLKSTTPPIALAELLAPTPTTIFTAAVPTGQTELASIAPDTAKQSPVDTALVEVTAPTATTIVTAPVATALVEVSSVTPTTSKAAPVPAGLIEVAAPQPATQMLAAVGVGLIEVAGIEPATAMSTSVGVGEIVVTAGSLDGAQSVSVGVGSVNVASFVTGTSKVTSVDVGRVEVSGMEATSSKSASVGVGLVEVASVAISTLMTASVDVGLVNVVGVAVNTSMAVSVAVGLVVIVGVAIDEPATQIAGELLFTVYVTPSIRSQADLSPSLHSTTSLQPTIKAKIT